MSDHVKTAPSKPPTKMNKSEFILSFADTSPVAEILAKAKERGISLSANQVYAVRSIARRAGKTIGGKTAETKRSKRGGRPSGGPARTFVEGIPLDTPVADVMTQAKAAGLTISANYVYKLRQRIRGGTSPAPPATLSDGPSGPRVEGPLASAA